MKPVRRGTIRRARRTRLVAPVPTQRRIMPFVIAGGGLLVVAIAVVLFVVTRPATPPTDVASFDVQSHNIVDGSLGYSQVPPVGGDHAQAVQNCGFYRSSVADENAVASMARGAVWITYKPDLNPDDINTIRQLAVDQTYVLESSYTGLPSNIVASAWGHQLQVDSSDDERLAQFIHAYRLSPDAPEKGPCAAGVGTPG